MCVCVSVCKISVFPQHNISRSAGKFKPKLNRANISYLLAYTLWDLGYTYANEYLKTYAYKSVNVRKTTMVSFGSMNASNQVVNVWFMIFRLMSCKCCHKRSETLANDAQKLERIYFKSVAISVFKRFILHIKSMCRPFDDFTLV